MAIEGKDEGRQVTSGPGGFNQADSANEPLIRTRVDGDAYDRFVMLADGTQYKGDGTARPGLVGPNVVWLPAARFTSVTGSPSQNEAGADLPSWLLDASAAIEALATYVWPEPGWQTCHVDLYWTNAGAGAGDVVFRTYTTLGVAGDGDTVAVGDNSDLAAIAAPAQNVIKVTRLLASAALTVDKPNRVFLGRLGSNVSDTLANDIGVLGVLLTKAS